MGELSKDDHKDYEAWDPGPELISVYDLVPKASDHQCSSCDNDDSSIPGNIVVDGVDKLSANYDVH